MTFARMTPKHWLLLALAFRLIGARTNISTGHPDEWFQTVEFAHYIAHGFAGQTPEFFLHMRNLTWPSLLAPWIQLSDWLSGNDLVWRMYFIKLATALADLTTFWALARILAARVDIPAKWKNWAWALFILPWFSIVESLRPSQEHLSSIALWWVLGALTSPAQSFMAGIALVMTGAFRYPSGLFGAGALAAILLQKLLKRDFAKVHLGRLAAGLAAGAVIGGFADWVFYGRPWESFWMYFQYNVLTGLSASNFGTHPATVYLTFFKGALGGVLLPLGIAAIALVPIGLIQGLRRVDPWAFALCFYVAGHLWIGHKEPRFMAPTLLPILWAIFEGGVFLAKISARIPLRAKQAVAAVAALMLVANSVLLLRALWGETWRTSYNFLRVSDHLASKPACAVITLRRPWVGLLPWKTKDRAPEPALAFWPAPSHQDSSTFRADRPLLWIAHAPECQDGQDVLLQPQKTETAWLNEGCTLLPSGPMRLFPESTWPKLVEKNWISAPWYRCPANLLKSFPKQEVRTVVATRMRRLPELPPPGIGGEEFLKRAWGELDPQASSQRDATFGDW